MGGPSAYRPLVSRDSKSDISISSLSRKLKVNAELFDVISNNGEIAIHTEVSLRIEYVIECFTGSTNHDLHTERKDVVLNESGKASSLFAVFRELGGACERRSGLPGDVPRDIHIGGGATVRSGRYGAIDRCGRKRAAFVCWAGQWHGDPSGARSHPPAWSHAREAQQSRLQLNLAFVESLSFLAVGDGVGNSLHSQLEDREL